MKIQTIRKAQAMIAILRTLPPCPGVENEINELERLIGLLRGRK